MSDEAETKDKPGSSLIRVAVVEYHRVYRDYLVALLNGTPGFRCTENFRSMEEALERIAIDLPDVALVDIGLPGMTGVEGIGFLKDRYPTILLLALTVYDDDERIFEALCAGASGYLLKKTQPAQLIEGLRDVIDGGAPMSPEVARRVVKLFREIRPHEKADYHLSPHETKILKLLMEGRSYRTVASELKVTPSTVSFHLQRIYEKLQVHSKTEAVAKALRNRLI
jgi:DNA-binding NarL/FixJ family response regulator